MTSKNRSVPVDTVLPHVHYLNLEEAMAWLTRVFGFQEHYRYGGGPSGGQMWAGKAAIQVRQAGHGERSPAQLVKLSRTGYFTLEPLHVAHSLDSMELDVTAGTEPTSLEMRWPRPAVLQTKVLRGHISDGLFSSHESPLKHKALSLRTLLAFDEIASAQTDDGGSFTFENVPNGLYFLRITLEQPTQEEPYGKKGDTVVSIDNSYTREPLSISIAYTSCGLSYDLTENKSRYVPQACFKGCKEVPCEY
jgi:hypothetical protein